MSLLDFVKGALGFSAGEKSEAIEAVTRMAINRERKRKTVTALRNRTDLARQKHIDWLRRRKQDLLAGSDPGSDTGDDQDLNQILQKFPGKMPIRASAEALDRLKSLKVDEHFDRIQFPPVFRNGEKIVAVNLSDRSADKQIGVVSTTYETDSNPASIDKIGITLDIDPQSDMLSCVVLYPAIPTGLAVRSQPSSVSQ